MKMPKSEAAYITRAYIVDLEPITSIAKRYDVSRQGLTKFLNTHGVDTSKKANGRITKPCGFCGEPVTRHRSYVRKHPHVHCNTECYYKAIEKAYGNSYKPNRQAMRIARKTVSIYFDLLPFHVTHHEDRDCTNNKIQNLKAFKSHSDHMKYHRFQQSRVTPVFDGSTL